MRGYKCLIRHVYKLSINPNHEGSFENEDRSTKHPKLENEAPKSRKRSTQNSKTKHPRSKTKHPKLENRAPKTLDTGLPFINTRPM